MHFSPRTLYFLYSGTCEACAVAEPEFDKFLRDNPMVWGLKVNVDFPGRLSGHARVTPTYVVLEAGELIWKHEGGLKAAQLAKVMGR